MTKFKIGDKVVAIDCTTGHGLDERVGTVVEADIDPTYEYYSVQDPEGSVWSMPIQDLKLFKETQNDKD